MINNVVSLNSGLLLMLDTTRHPIPSIPLSLLVWKVITCMCSIVVVNRCIEHDTLHVYIRYCIIIIV